MELQTRLTVDQAAIHAGKRPETLYAWIVSGFLPATKRLAGRGYEIDLIDLEKALARPRKRSDKRLPLRPWTKVKNERALERYRKRRENVRQY